MNSFIGSILVGLLLAFSLWIAPLPSTPLEPVLRDPVYRSTSPSKPPSSPQVAGTSPTVTSRPPVAVGDCGAWAAYATRYGWPSSQTAQLAKIMHRESRCDPTQIGDQGNSYGLLQIHCPSWVAKSTYWPDGWAAANGYPITCQDLLDPATNLALGFLIWSGVPGSSGGWSAWTTYNP